MIDDRVRGTGSAASDAEIEAATPRQRGGNQARVGLFVIAGFISVVAVIFLMTNPATLRGRYMVFTRLSDAGGIREGDAVQMRGVIIGRVHAFEFVNDNQEVSVELEIEGDKHIPTDSYSRLAGAGLVGGRTMEVVPGIAASFVEEGDTIPSASAVGGIMETAEDVALRAGTVLDQMNKLLSDPTIASVQSTASETERMMRDLRAVIAVQQRQLADLTASLNRSAAGLETLTDSVNGALGGVRPSLTSATARADSTMAQIRITSERLDRTAASIDSILGRLNAGQGSMGKFLNDDAFYNNFSRAADEIALLAKDLRENPKKYLNFRLIGF
jgi:phospholipid/cholesterol/gamma-HCH transport system substrate-binding protein